MERKYKDGQKDILIGTEIETYGLKTFFCWLQA